MEIKSIRAKVGAMFDAITLPEKYILPLFTIQYGCGSVDKPDFLNLNGSIGHGKHDGSLYYNGILFFRVMLPFFIGFHLRWSAKAERQYLQTHLGWKKNGDFAVTIRIQNDVSSAAGTYGHNYGQAQGFSCGPH